MENEQSITDHSLPDNFMEEANRMVNSVESTSNCYDSSKSFESGEGDESQEYAGGMIDETFLLRDDVVICAKYEGVHGVVIEVAGDAYYEGSISSNNDNGDDGDGTGGSGTGGGDGRSGHGNTVAIGVYESLPEKISDFLSDGYVRIRWTDGSETEEYINDTAVVDRRFLHGDTVASSSDSTGQLGLVLDVSIMVDLLAADGEVIERVPSKDLKRTRDPRVGDYVVLGSCFGVVHDVFDSVTVIFDSGYVKKFVKADPLRLEPLSIHVTNGAGSSYHPGQRVRIGSNWLSGLCKAYGKEGTVIKVEAESVIVNWKQSAYLGLGTNLTEPSREQDPKNLTLLSGNSYEDWKLGDWCHILSHPFKSSSFPNEASETSKYSYDLAEQHTNIHMSSCLEGSDQVQGGLDSVHGDHEAAEVPADGTTVLDNMNKVGENGTAFPEMGPCRSSPPVSREIKCGTWRAYWKRLHEVFFFFFLGETRSLTRLLIYLAGELSQRRRADLMPRMMLGGVVGAKSSPPLGRRAHAATVSEDGGADGSRRRAARLSGIYGCRWSERGRLLRRREDMAVKMPTP